MTKKPHSELDLLAVGAHPDDVELSCGGIIANAVALGQKVGIVDLTLGELSSRGDLEIRGRETAAASAVLGIKVRENLKLPDGDVGGRQGDKIDSRTQLERVVEMLRRLRPAVLLLPFWEDRHPDHTAASQLLTDAVFYAGLSNFKPNGSLTSFTPQAVFYFQMRHAFTPSFIVDVSAVYEKKIDAAKCYRSQLGLNADGNSELDPSKPQTLISSPRTLEILDARDRYYGAMIGVVHGEPLLAKTALAVKDPVEYVRTQFAGPSLFFPALGSGRV